jgi:hypothetical protein
LPSAVTSFTMLGMLRTLTLERFGGFDANLRLDAPGADRLDGASR